jgi:PIN domain nuclease of toxin-antitoxin system
MEVLENAGIAILPVKPSHIARLETLPHHHRDPFDRMLIAQAMSENLALMSVDPAFSAYDVAIA